MDFLNYAVELAVCNIKTGGTPYGAVVVKDGEIIGEGVNTLHTHFDISGHAEMIAIRQAQLTLSTNDLSDCEIYASGHPCPMCFGAIAFVGIKKIVYANSLEEAEAAGMGLSKNIYDYLMGDKTKLDINVVHLPIQKDEKNPMIIYSNRID